MRLKTYTAQTMAEAMALVRREMGEDAIIVSTSPAADGRGARVTAAAETAEPEYDWSGDDASAEAPSDADAEIRQALTSHSTPPQLVDRLARAARVLETDDATMALAGAFDTVFTFAPIGEPTAGTVLMLVGMPGAGKTITTAKLAARARLAGQPVTVVTTDTRRAGGAEQLRAFTRILELDLIEADTAGELATAIKQSPGGPVYVDTAGTNPFSDAELDALAELTRSSAAEPILVHAAGGDAQESAEVAACFAGLGIRRLLATRLDLVRRFGGLLAAVDAPRLAFTDVSVTPHIADGLSPLNPVSLARLILPGSSQSSAQPHIRKAAP